MKKEKIVLSFIAVLMGLLVAGVAFFIYQSTKSIPVSKIPVVNTKQPTESANPSVFLTIDTPSDQSVTANKTLTISGKTTPGVTLVLITDNDNQVVTPSRDGGFSITTTLGDGLNQIILTAIALSGEEVKKTLNVTYSTEEF